MLTNADILAFRMKLKKSSIGQIRKAYIAINKEMETRLAAVLDEEKVRLNLNDVEIARTYAMVAESVITEVVSDRDDARKKLDSQLSLTGTPSNMAKSIKNSRLASQRLIKVAKFIRGAKDIEND